MYTHILTPLVDLYKMHSNQILNNSFAILLYEIRVKKLSGFIFYQNLIRLKLILFEKSAENVKLILSYFIGLMLMYN